MGTAQFLRGLLRLINTTTALQNGKMPSYDELDQIAADLEIALAHDFEVAQSALESVYQLKDLLDKLNLPK